MLLSTLECLQRTKHTGLLLTIKENLCPAFAKLRGAPSPNDVPATVGECWVSFGRFLLKLYVPDAPIDPAGLRRSTIKYWEDQRSIIELQMHMHKALAGRTDGNECNATIQYLEALLADMPPRSSEHLLPDVSESRLNVTRLHMFWSEVRQFISQVLSHQKVDHYIAITYARDTAAPLHEQVLQDSLSTFSQRLNAFFADFSDITSPILLGLLSVRLGLSVFTHARFNLSSTLEERSPICKALLAFPSVRSAELLRKITLGSTTTNSPFAVVLVRLAAISYEVQLGSNIQSHIHDIEQIYERALGLWSVEQARIEEAEREAQSLYRRKDEGNLNEAEEEEQDFLSLFPEFEDILDPDDRNVQQVHKKPKALIDSAAASRLFEIHQEIFLFAGTRLAAASSRFFEDRKSLVHELAESEGNSWPDSLDEHSTAFQTRLLCDRIDTLKRASQSSSRSYDFYFDANIPEVKKAIDTLHPLLQRLEILIREWPDQMVLQHLKSRCVVVTSFSIHSPLAKVLSALENLLGTIEDWEMYANRDNSLKAYQHTLIALVVDWRRLELSSWQGLLDAQAAKFEQDASAWWFRLYNAAIRGVLDAEGDDNGIEIFLGDLVPLLDDFVASAPLGQFHSRLRLISSMQSYADQLSAHHKGNRHSALRRVYRILANTSAYYQQFETKINKSVVEQRAELEKNIRDFIKLASWKDVNIHALKQSAQKTHRQLYKVIRKFRDVLRQPITALLGFGPSDAPGSNASVSARQTYENSLSLDTIPSLPAYSTTVDIPAHLANLPKTFRNFEILIQDKVISFMDMCQPCTVESLSQDIITVSKTLSNISISASGDASRQMKLAKNLLTRKRKAWSDFAKELKRAGFSVNVKPEILQQNQSRLYLREQSCIPPHFHNVAAALKSEEYLHRVSGLLPQIRQALSDHHPDLSTRDLQRAVAYIEHIFFVSLQTRSS